MPTPPYRGWLSPIGTRNSASPTTTGSDKTRGPESRFYHSPDGSQLTSTVETAIRTLSYSADRRRPAPSGPSEVGSGRVGVLDRAERDRDRGPGANRPAHRPDQPEAAPCGPTRKGDRTRDDLREDRPDVAVRGCLRRSAVLHLTFVRTTQEPLSPASTGSTATEGAEVRGARASWQLGAPSHPTDAPRWSA